MGNASRRKRKQRQQESAPRPPREPWMKWRSGMRALALVSLVLAIFVGWQVYPAGGLGQATLYGLGFGLSIWVVFFIMYRFNRWIQRR